MSDFKTLCEAFQHTAQIDPDAIALRTVGGAVSISWGEYRARVERIAAGLHTLGVRPGDTVALLLANRPEFNLVDTAAVHLGASPFSIYNTASAEQIAFLLSNADSRVIVTEQQYVDVIHAASPSIEHVILVDGDGPGSLTALEQTDVPDFDFEAGWRAVQAGDVATLIYTSGTTGPPKGVELTHSNLLAEIEGITALVDVNYGDRITSYLPSAHIADRLSTHYVQLVKGSQVTSVADARVIAAALTDVRPTFWVAVPRVWDKLKMAIEASIQAAEEPAASAMKRAITLGVKNARGTLEPSEQPEYAALDAAVLSKLRAKVGFDELRWALSGAAAIGPETLEFFMALGIDVLEMWGMSECCGAGTVNPRGKPKVGSVGVPLPNLETKVAEDGELLVRGPIITRGYRNDPERTAEAFDSDGWFATGDLVTVDDDGYITIVDRKKELIVNAAGKNMSPANIESTVKAGCSLIGQVVAIGDGRPYNTALVVLDSDAVVLYARARNLEYASPATLATDPAVIAAVTESISAGNQKLSRIEQIKRFRILPTSWEPGGTEVTPTMKLKRKPISDRYADEIESLYSEPCVDEVHEVTERRKD